MSKFFYGSFVHEFGEVYPQEISLRTINNNRNIPWYIEAKMMVRGQVCRCTQAELNTRIDQINDAYKFHFKDAGFFLADGTTISEHYFRTDDPLNLTGNRVSYFSWDNVEQSEMVNVRSFTAIIEAKFESSYTSLLDLKESITMRGTNEPSIRAVPTWNGGILFQQQYGTSGPVEVTQQGTLVGTVPGFALPRPWFPVFENKKYRVITRHSGVPWGSPHGAAPTHSSYAASYRYVMEIPSPFARTPNLWQNAFNYDSGQLSYPAGTPTPPSPPALP
jgi:hypothetical protein